MTSESKVSLTNPTNRRDPLLGTGPDAARALFDSMTKVCHGFGRDAVVDAAVNILVNAMRQDNPRREKAEAAFDELFGKTKTLLLKHYDSVTGNRRHVFPFTQVVHAQLVHWEDQFNLKK